MIEPPIFDVSGVDGASGISGVSYGGRADTGCSGDSGGDGTDGHCGTSAGTISVRLTTPTTADIPKNMVLTNPIDAAVQLGASIVSSAGSLQKMDTIMKVKSGELISFFTRGGHGGNGGHGGHGQHGGHGYRHGTFLVLSFNKLSEYAWRTEEGMPIRNMTLLMAVMVVAEDMAVTQVEAVMVEPEEEFEFVFPKPTLISFFSVVLTIILAGKGVQQGIWG